MSRKYMRHPAEIPIEIVQEADNKTGEETKLKQLHDISYGGLCFDSPTRQAEHQPIRIRITVGDSPFEVDGCVAWCRKKRGHFEVGVTFVGEDEANRVRMVEQVCQIETYRHRVLKTEGRKLSNQEAALEWIRKYAARFPGVMRFSSVRR